MEEPDAQAAPLAPLTLLCGDKQWHDQTGEVRVCGRETGHEGWHHDSNRIESWPPVLPP